jgi:hypothetical protein
MDWRCGSSDRAPASQTPSLSSNPSPAKKKKKQGNSILKNVFNERIEKLN